MNYSDEYDDNMERRMSFVNKQSAGFEIYNSAILKDTLCGYVVTYPTFLHEDHRVPIIPHK